MGRKVVYTSQWINLYQDTVRLPDGTTIDDYHVLDFPSHAAGIVPVGADGRILLIDHYRFVSDVRGWEIPAGRIDEGESPEQAAMRELREEAAHSSESVVKLGHYCAAIGSSNLVFHLFMGRGASPTGGEIDRNEAMAVRWFTPADVRRMIERNEILDGLSLTALLWAMMRGLL